MCPSSLRELVTISHHPAALTPEPKVLSHSTFSPENHSGSARPKSHHSGRGWLNMLLGCGVVLSGEQAEPFPVLLQVALQCLWSIKIVVLVKPEHERRISHVHTSSVKTGIANTLGGHGDGVGGCPRRRGQPESCPRTTGTPGVQSLACPCREQGSCGCLLPLQWDVLWLCQLPPGLWQ